MSRIRFLANRAPSVWHASHELTQLAELCEGAGLTPIQAEVVRLASERRSHAEVAELLGLDRTTAQGIARSAERKLKKSQSWVLEAMRRDLSATLFCLRNTFSPNPRPSIIRRIAGGYDTVRFAADPFGMRPEDLIEEPGRLLRSLRRLLGEFKPGRRVTQPE